MQQQQKSEIDFEAIELYRRSVLDARQFAQFLFDDANDRGSDPIYRLTFLRTAATRMSELIGLPPPSARGRARKYLDVNCGVAGPALPPSGKGRVRPVV